MNRIMKRTIFFLLTLFPVMAFAQPPMWTQNAYRERSYAAHEWYTGFVSDRLKAGEDVGKALKALEKDAQNQLAESIIVTIEGNSSVDNRSYQHQSDGKNSEVITTQYQQAVSTATKATAVKTEVKSYHDPETGALYAFAAVKRTDLAAFYAKQIDVDLNKVETAMEAAEQLVAAGKKMSAKRKIEDAKKILENVVFYRDLLVAVNANADEGDLQTQRSNNLQRIVAQLLITLEHSTFVYLTCTYEFKGYKDDAFKSDPGIFCDFLSQTLSENDCVATENKEEADYELSIITSTSQRSDGTGVNGIISYYANVKVTLFNRMTQKKTVEFSIFNDPDAYSAGKSPEDAGTKAFKLPELRQKVLNKILPKIKD